MAISSAPQKYEDLFGVVASGSHQLDDGINGVELFALSASRRDPHHISPLQCEHVVRSRHKNRRAVAGARGQGASASGIQVRQPEFTARNFISRAFEGARTVGDTKELKQLLGETG